MWNSEGFGGGYSESMAGGYTQSPGGFGSPAGTQGEKKSEAGSESIVIPPGTYVKVTGHLRSFQGKKSLVAFKIAPLEDMNELISHILEVVQAHMILSKPQGMTSGNNSIAIPARTGMTSMGNSSMVTADSSINGLTAHQSQVLNLIKACRDAQGMHINELKTKLKGMNLTAIKQDVLCSCPPLTHTRDWRPPDPWLRSGTHPSPRDLMSTNDQDAHIGDSTTKPPDFCCLSAAFCGSSLSPGHSCYMVAQREQHQLKRLGVGLTPSFLTAALERSIRRSPHARTACLSLLHRLLPRSL
ncbi:RFA2B protein, partial [Polypterus senegalus]